MKDQHVFIVDDDNTFVKYFSKKLSNDGIKKISTYSSGEDCIKNMNSKPDLILLDYMMDGMDGIDTIREIKKKHKDIPVVFLSSNDNKEVADSAFQNDAFDYVVKNEAAFSRVRLLMKRIHKLEESIIEKRKAKMLKRIFIATFIIFIAAVFTARYFFPNLL